MAKVKAETPDEPWTDDLDRMPLDKRRRMLHLSEKPSLPPASSISSSPCAPSAPPVDMAVKRVSPLREWPGLPRGVKFDPSDEELLWHLLAKVGKGEAEPHPLISEFIISVDEDEGFNYTHPQSLAGVKKDGSVSYFFHRRLKAVSSRNRKCQKMQNADFRVVCWHKIGKTKPVIIDGIHQGCKKIMVLYVGMKEGEKPEKTNWVMHQYHIGRGEDSEGEFVSSKIFYQQKSRQSDKKAQDLNLETAEAVVMEEEAAVEPVSMGTEIHAENEFVSVEASVKDGISRFSVDLVGGIKEYVTGQVLDEHHSADTELPWEECYANGACEVAVAEFMSISPIDSPDSTITSSSFAVDQSPPCAMSCQNSVMLGPEYSLENQTSGTRFSCQALVPEVKSFVKEEEQGYMVSNSELHSSIEKNSEPQSPAFSAFLVQAGPLEEGSVNGLSEMDTSMEYTAGMLGAGDKGFEEGSFTDTCLSEARSCPHNILFEVSKTQESNGEHITEAHFSEFKMSNLGKGVVHQNDYNKLSDSIQSTFPIKVKTEPLEEAFTKGTLETTAERLRYDNSHLFDNVPIEVKAEHLGESYTNSVPEASGQELQNTSISGYPTQNLFAATQSSLKDKLLSGGGNLEENLLPNCTFLHHTSLPKRGYWSSNATELLSSTVLESGSSHFSVNSCILSQFSESSGGCQNKVSVIGSNLQDNTDYLGFCQGSISEGDHFDSPNNLQNANCAVKVKSEPLEREQPTCKEPPFSFPEFYKLRAEVKREFLDEDSTDVFDHIPLKYRIEMPFSDSISNFNCGDSLKHSKQVEGRPSQGGSHNLNAKRRRSSCRRKRKRTATDSVETALEEDSPGLLQVLLDKGITIEEIKLYGDTEDDEPLEISSSDDSFKELETVITKLFYERSSLLKFSAGRHINSSKAVYCLACLISLIEQTRYLRFRNSPVEWGWCRDLQSFVFVFESHNRIVLERPEYGYATYFFELVDSLPVVWQIKRLVTTMKLSSCSRTTLIENRDLVVGEDLSEGEARVLEEYGWTPNTGIATMLNYCDRVIHDKRNEMYNLEWRSKIGKLLMNGHDAGRTVVVNLPKKVVNYMDNRSSAVEL